MQFLTEAKKKKNGYHFQAFDFYIVYIYVYIHAHFS